MPYCHWTKNQLCNLFIVSLNVHNADQESPATKSILKAICWSSPQAWHSALLNRFPQIWSLTPWTRTTLLVASLFGSLEMAFCSGTDLTTPPVLSCWLKYLRATNNNKRVTGTPLLPFIFSEGAGQHNQLDFLQTKFLLLWLKKDSGKHLSFDMIGTWQKSQTKSSHCFEENAY